MTNITLDSYFPEWESARRGTVKPSTERRCYLNYYNNISPVLGSLSISSIDRRKISKLQHKLYLKGMRESTVNMIIATLHRILSSAVLDELVPKNACTGVASLRPTGLEARDTIHRALSDDELSAFFNMGAKYTYILTLKLLLLTGMRAGEACALAWRDIDLENGIISIRKTVSLAKGGYCLLTPKTKTSRRDIPMNPQIVELLKEQERRSFPHPDGRISFPDYFVFQNQRGGFITPTTLNITIIRILDKLSLIGYPIEHFSSHAFRDTFATRAVEAGMKPETLQGILGHNNIMLTMNQYYHLSEEKKRREMQLVNYPDF